MLTDDGGFILNVYQDDVVARFQSLNNVYDVTAYRTADGSDALMWRGLRYTSERFLQNAFTQRGGDEFPGVFCALEERVWRSSEIQRLATGNGWRVAGQSAAAVGDGGAEGWLCDTLRFERPRGV